MIIGGHQWSSVVINLSHLVDNRRRTWLFVQIEIAQDPRASSACRFPCGGLGGCFGCRCFGRCFGGKVVVAGDLMEDIVQVRSHQWSSVVISGHQPLSPGGRLRSSTQSR